MIRKFYLCNENDNTFTLYGYGRNKTDIETLDNLGFEFDIDYSDFDGRFVEIDRTIPQKTISMTLIFYEGYDGFTKWREFVTKSKTIRLFYSLNDTKYCYVNVKSSSKTQLEYGILRSSIELECLSLWLVNKSATITVKKTDAGKTYNYLYPYTYAVSYNGKITVNNASSRSVPLKLTLKGNCLNPRVIIYQDNTAVSTLRLIMNERETPTIIVNAEPTDQYIKKVTASLEEDIYNSQDFSCDNFLFLPSGTSVIFFDPGVREPCSCLIEYKEEYVAH